MRESSQEPVKNSLNYSILSNELSAIQAKGYLMEVKRNCTYTQPHTLFQSSQIIQIK